MDKTAEKTNSEHKENAPIKVDKTVSESSGNTRARRVIVTAALLASTIVLSRFLAIRTPIITINFAFLPIMLAGMLMGWRGGVFVAVVADLIGAILFPSGSFFIGYTVTALFKGLTAGLLLYNKNGLRLDKKFVLKLILCVVIWTALLNGVLNTVWIMITSGSAANLIVPVRVAKQLIMAPIQVIMIIAFVKLFGEKLNQLVRND